VSSAPFILNLISLMIEGGTNAHGMVNGIGARYKDLTNKRFGRLLALKDEGRDNHKNAIWLCRCDCGTEKKVTSAQLVSHKTSSCGCLAREMVSERKLVDLTGRRFGKLTIASRAQNSSHGKAMWNVICDCGTEKAIIGSSMTTGRTITCGCGAGERGLLHRTHGMSTSKEYQTWGSMIARCHIESATGYENYGGRGIKSVMNGALRSKFSLRTWGASLSPSLYRPIP
jgi:hypothetical protein